MLVRFTKNLDPETLPQNLTLTGLSRAARESALRLQEQLVPLKHQLIIDAHCCPYNLKYFSI